MHDALVDTALEVQRRALEKLGAKLEPAERAAVGAGHSRRMPRAEREGTGQHESLSPYLSCLLISDISGHSVRSPQYMSVQTTSSRSGGHSVTDSSSFMRSCKSSHMSSRISYACSKTNEASRLGAVLLS